LKGEFTLPVTCTSCDLKVDVTWSCGKLSMHTAWRTKQSRWHLDYITVTSILFPVTTLGQVDFAETTETETWKQKLKHRKYCACSLVPSRTADLISDATLGHVFFASISAPVLSGRQLPWFLDQGCLFCGSFFFSFLFIHKRFMPVASVTHKSKVLVQNVQPKDEEK